MVSVEALAYYSVAFTLASMTTMFSVAMIQSLIPAFSQLQADDKRAQLESLYSRGVRLNLIVLVPALVLLSIIAKPFFILWAGPDFGRESISPFHILLIGLVFNIPAYLPYAAIMASGPTDIFAKLYFAELVPYVILVSFLTWKFGANGARRGMDNSNINRRTLPFRASEAPNWSDYSKPATIYFRWMLDRDVPSICN